MRTNVRDLASIFTDFDRWSNTDIRDGFWRISHRKKDAHYPESDQSTDKPTWKVKHLVLCHEYFSWQEGSVEPPPRRRQNTKYRDENGQFHHKGSIKNDKSTSTGHPVHTSPENGASNCACLIGWCWCTPPTSTKMKIHCCRRDERRTSRSMIRYKVDTDL